MPDLEDVLQGHDLSFLKMVAGAWGIELTAADAHSALPVLLSEIPSRLLVEEMVDSLPPEANEALNALVEAGGALPWAMFCRKYGEVRSMGAARRDRERPDLKPASAAEVLWYRAMIGRAFLTLDEEPQEYAYIPSSLLELLPPAAPNPDQPLGRPASPTESAVPLPADDRILDYACTVLAALRLEMDLSVLDTNKWPLSARELLALLCAAGLVTPELQPVPEAARAFLEAPRSQALAQLARAWLDSESFNELRLTPGLEFEGEWHNQPLPVRHLLLEWVGKLPTEVFWSISAFIAAVKDRQPDFQRPAGDYDSWFIRSASTGEFLRGFEAWDQVEGALLRYILTGPLHWLGMLDLAAPAKDAAPTAFRPSRWAEALWHGLPPPGLAVENAAPRVHSDGRISLPALTPRSLRYQIARFCEWEGELRQEYVYRLTPASLERAALQGLKPVHLVALLRKSVAGPLPPSLLAALEHWEKLGVQAALKRATLLTVSSPEILAALRKSRAARYLGELLNPTTILILPGGEISIQAALAELGYLADARMISS